MFGINSPNQDLVIDIWFYRGHSIMTNKVLKKERISFMFIIWHYYNFIDCKSFFCNFSNTMYIFIS